MRTASSTGFTRRSVLGAGALLAPSLIAAPAVRAQGKTFVMKLSTATINDTQHEWFKRFAAAVEKDSGGRIKGEIYPASQLGPIPRQIEGVQFGSIQAYMGPPEFLVGVDARYEALSAPGLFTSTDQAVRVINDPAVQKLFFGLGEKKGLVGIGFAPIGASSMALKGEVHHLADLNGKKIRVLASQFQLEMVRRMGASPIAMTLGDVLPAIQQGAIDGALGAIIVWTTMQYQDAAKYVLVNEQPYLNSIIVMSRKWLFGLPPDLQKIVLDAATRTSRNIVPFVKEWVAKQYDIWKTRGGVLIRLPPDEQAAMMAKISTIGEDLSKDKPELNAAVKLVFETAQRAKS
jgi:TRAP-type transport system periplasmic protein